MALFGRKSLGIGGVGPQAVSGIDCDGTNGKRCLQPRLRHLAPGLELEDPCARPPSYLPRPLVNPLNR